jgi:hypothetical protein
MRIMRMPIRKSGLDHRFGQFEASLYDALPFVIKGKAVYLCFFTIGSPV